MSLEKVRIGAYAGIYIGDFGSLTPLVQITPLNKDDTTVTDELGNTYFPGINLQLQTSLHSVGTELKFYSDDLLFFNLNKGISISNTNRNTPNGGVAYTLLLIDNSDDPISVLIPKCFTVNRLAPLKSKKTATEVTVTFSHVSPNVYEDIIVYDTPDNLYTLLGGRAP